MNIAQALNQAFTGATLRQGRPEPKLEAVSTANNTITFGYPKPAAALPEAFSYTFGHPKLTGRARLAANRLVAPAPAPDALKAVVLQHQGAMYRAFHALSQQLVHSHTCKVEVVRRCERDGFYFIHLS